MSKRHEYAQRARERAAAIDRRWLEYFVDYAQGDPHLTAWEEAFVSSMRHYLNRTGDYAGVDRGWRLSHRQLDICHQIEEKLQEIELGLRQDEPAAEVW